jgi:putative ABC transport system permease protein
MEGNARFGWVIQVLRFGAMLVITDLRRTLRSLARSPGFFALSVATLALGIAANTTLFSVARSVLWRPLPFPEPERLVWITEQNLRQAGGVQGVAIGNFQDWRRRAQSFESLAAFQWSRGRTISGSGFAERIRAAAISDGYLETLGVRPVLGRVFKIDEPRSIILSDALWRHLFDGSPDVLGRVVKMDGEPYSVVGVLPPGFRHEVIEDPDMFVPLAVTSEDRESKSLAVIGRLKAGVTAGEAAAEMGSVSAELAHEYPQANGNWGAKVEDLRLAFTKFDQGTLRLFLGFGGFVLLIACANVAALLLVRFVTRQTEFALRMALGANRQALLRHALAESVWIAIPGGAGGAILAAWGVAAIQKSMPPNALVRSQHIAMDATALASVLAISLLTTFIFGLVPAAMAAKVDVESALRDWGKSISGSARARRRIGILVAAEVTLATVLLFGAGLFISSYFRLQRAELGFSPHGVLSMRVLPGARQRGNVPALRAFYRQAIEKVAGVPGVREVAVSNGLPLDFPASVSLSTPDRPHPPRGEEHSSLARIVSPAFFPMMGMTLLRGRWFNGQDSETAPRVAIVNENLAREIFGAQDPVGQDLLVLNGDAAIPPGSVRIVGVALNVKELSQDEIPFADIYLPFAQNPASSMHVLAKADASAAALIRQRLRGIDADEAIFNVKTLDEHVSASLRGARFHLALVSVFAALAVILASIGVYGAMSFSVAQRTREFGLRMALGARPSSILWATMKHSARLAILGCATGVAISFALGEMMKSALYLAPHQHSGLIYGVGVRDPASFAAAVGIVLLLAAIAGIAPASRAAGLDPLSALRRE